MMKKDQASSATSSTDASKKLGVIGLIAVIISAMVGGGIFSLPQNMASGSGAGGVIIAWIITAIGMWFIANTFRILAAAKPDLTAGIYMYAQEGFGNFSGFFVGFGYWISNCFALAAYSILAMDTLNYFFPYFKGGNNIPAIIVGSFIVWIMFFICLAGVKSASFLNVIGTIGKLIPVLIFLIIIIFGFKISLFLTDFWGNQTIPSLHDHNLNSSILSQVKSTMLVVLWLFMGIEGAVVVSGRAKSQKDVGKSTFIGYIFILIVYALVSLLPYGSFSQGELAKMSNPSVAQIMLVKVGEWGSVIINIGVLISVLSSWLAWMVMLGEIPYAAAKSQTFPKAFLKQNKKGANSTALLWTTIVIQVTLILSYFAGNAWDTMISVTSAMAVPCYFFSCLYLFKLTIKKQYPTGIFASKTNAFITGLIGSLFTLFIFYSAGLNYLLMALIAYAIGVPLFIYTRKKDAPGEKVFTKTNIFFVCAIYILTAIAIVYIFMKYM